MLSASHAKPSTAIKSILISLFLFSGCATNPPDSDKMNDPAYVMDEAKAAFKAKQYNKVFSMVYPLALSGHDHAQYTVGYLFFHGLGIEKSERQAMIWIQQAAAQGNTKALQALQD